MTNPHTTYRMSLIRSDGVKIKKALAGAREALEKMIERTDG